MSTVEFNYNCSINEAFQHSSFKVMHGYQPSTNEDRPLLLTGANADTTDRLRIVSDIRNVLMQNIATNITQSAAADWLRTYQKRHS